MCKEEERALLKPAPERRAARALSTAAGGTAAIAPVIGAEQATQFSDTQTEGVSLHDSPH